MNVAELQQRWPQGTGGLSETLSAAVEKLGLSSGAPFSENLQPEGGEHLVVADPDSRLVARLRPTDETDVDTVSKNLQAISTLARRQGPVLAPAWPDPLLLQNQRRDWVATLWPHADNRLVTPDEMAEMLRCLHDTPPPDGLDDWLDVCFGTVRANVQALLTIQPAPPQALVDECITVVDAMMSRLEALVAESPWVLVHGDSHPANIVVLDGRLLACDLDRICLGPPEADLVIPLSHSRTYPGADPDAGENLVTAYSRGINRELLDAAVDVRGIYKTEGLVRTWTEPHALESLAQRLDAVRANSRFARLHGTEKLCPFAPRPDAASSLVQARRAA